MQGSPQPRGSCSVRAGAPHGLCPVPGTSPMPQAAPLGWHSSRGTDCEPVPTSHLHPLPAGTGGWGCSPSAPQVPQGWAQPAPTQALLPGAAEPRWQPGAEDQGQQRTLGRVLSPWNCVAPPRGEGPESREQHPHSGSMMPSWGAAPHPAEQHLNPESSSPIPESRIPVRGAGPHPGEQHPSTESSSPIPASRIPMWGARPHPAEQHPHIPGADVPRGHPPCPPPPRSRTHERLLRDARGDAVRGSGRSAHWGGRRRAKRPVPGQ